MSNNLIFISIVALTIFIISTYVFVMIRFTDTQKMIEELSAKQFDAEQVMKMYQQKYVKPIVYQDRADVKELKYDIRIPMGRMHICGSEKEFEEEVKKDIARNYSLTIAPYIDYAIDNDMVRLEKVFHSRLRVVSK